ncbi:MAG: MFS transporter [Thermotoga caldifontis]|uniref:MFS transporter n=1 Tax=Thermotoga caldifontis TaxID=1508419 RepID=UPI003C7A4B26
MEKERLSLKAKIGYGIGDLYGGGAFIIIGTYYLYFLTDVMRINPALAGTVIMMSKIWDAITDPIMGVISDRTRTRFGRRRFYFLIGIPLIFLSFFLMWYVPNFHSELSRFYYALFSYIFFATIITMVMIPYNALAPELTMDYNERISLNSFRMFFSMLSSVLCAILPLEIVKRFPSPRTGFTAMGVFFGIFFALPFILVFTATRERPEFWKETKFSFRENFIEPFKNRSFVHVLLMYLFSFLSMDVIMSILVYYMTHYLNRGQITNLALGTLIISEILFVPFWSALGKRFGKKTAFTLGLTVWIVAMFFSLAILPTSPTFVIYLFAAVVGVGTGCVVVMIYSIFADIPDTDELRSGQRREGIFSGLFTFMRKLSSAVGLFLISNIIALAGYIPPKEEIIDGVKKLVQQPQSESFITALRFLFALIPVGLLLISLFVAIRYPLTKSVHEKLKAILEMKRKDKELPQEMAKEEEHLKKLLLGER